MKVRLKSGEEKWILVHIEVQGKSDKAFSKRMFQYFYRIYDRYEEKIIAVAVHTSLDQINEMRQFEYDYFGTKLMYTYNNYRTEDYSNEALEHSKNIFSKIVLAAKGLHQTKNEAQKRYRFKRKLMNDLIRNQQFSRTAVMATLHFIDYLLRLPKEYMKQLSKEIVPVLRKESGLMELYNEENAPPTVLESFAERIEKSLEQGRVQGKEESKIDVILTGTKNKIDVPTLAMLTGYSEEHVREIIKEKA